MMTRRGVLAAAAAAPLLNFARAASGDAGLVVRDNRLFLDVVVDGHPVRALLDSAAESSFMDASFAKSIGIAGSQTVGVRGSGGDEDAQLAKGVKVDVLGMHLGPLTVALLDLSDVGKRLLKAPLPFVLGRELFDAAPIFVDIERGQIRALPRGYRASGVRLDLSDERGIETLPVSIEGHPAVGAAFDLGNGGDVLLGAEYAKGLGLLTDGRPITEKKGGGIGGEKIRQTITLRSLEIAGQRFVDVPAAIDTTGSATRLNIGVPILRKFEIVSDFPARCIWLKAK